MSTKLKETIGKKTLLMLTINAILGTGIYFLPAVGAFYSGSSSILSWVIMSAVAIFISFYFAELISLYPKSGGSYGFVKNAFGSSSAFLFGWISWLVSNITIGMLIVGSIKYILPGADFLLSISLALIFILLFNIVNYRGIDFSSKMLLFFGAMTVGTLVALILPGLAAVNMNNFSSVFNFSPLMIMLTTYFIAETFFGWESTTYLSEEIKNARKVFPKILVLATVVIAAISILIVFVALGNSDAALFSLQAAPLAFLAEKFFGASAGGTFAIIIFIPLIGTAASWIVSSPRLLYAMSRDRTLVPCFGKIHKKYRTPHQAILFQTIVTIGITLLAFGNYIFLLSLLVPLVVFMYSLIMLSVVKLRIDKPKMKRYFSAPFPKAGPVVVILFNLMLLYVWLTQVSDALHIFLMGIILIFLGVPLYIMIRLQTNQKFTERFFDAISWFWNILFPIWYGRNEREKVIRNLALKKDSTVLDFGCGSGLTTLEIAKRAPFGTVVGIDISVKQLRHAIRKIKKERAGNIILIKQHRMKFRRSTFDAITGVDVLGYINDPRRMMKKIIFSLKKGGHFSFMSFGSSLGTPAPHHLRNEKEIKRIFSGLSIELHIRKEKSKMSEYWYIWGTKK